MFVCQTVTTLQEMYIQPGRPVFTGPQGGLVIIQSTGAVTTGTHGYEEACQLFVYIPQQLHVSYILERIEVFFSHRCCQ